MPANLTPQYMSAEQRFKQATTHDEKITCLEEMLRVMPKHKGTDKLQADLKRRLSKLRQEAQKTAATHRGHTLSVEAEGAGQIVMVGPPNVGKSALLAALTKATPEVADYPFTTRRPMPGMMAFENVQIQLVDMPPISHEYMESWMSQITRNADALLLVVDLERPGRARRRRTDRWRCCRSGKSCRLPVRSLLRRGRARRWRGAATGPAAWQQV